MTTYTAITATETNPDAPITSSLLKRLADNPLAIAEGDASAPKISAAALAVNTVATDWVMARIAAAAVYAVGAYVFAVYNQPGGVSAGGVYAGSSLNIGGVGDTSFATSLQFGGALSGSWMCCGYGLNYPIYSNGTLFRRVA